MEWGQVQPEWNSIRMKFEQSRDLVLAMTPSICFRAFILSSRLLLVIYIDNTLHHDAKSESSINRNLRDDVIDGGGGGC